MAETAIAAGRLIPDNTLLCLAEQLVHHCPAGAEPGALAVLQGGQAGLSVGDTAAAPQHATSPTACNSQPSHTSTATKPGPVRQTIFFAVLHYAGSLQQTATKCFTAPGPGSPAVLLQPKLSL